MTSGSLHRSEIKQLRSDARKLETVAKHLRQQAKDLAMEEKANKARAGFFAKQSKVDPSVTLEPFTESELREIRSEVEVSHGS